MITPVKFPVDFEEQVKLPPAVGGKGSPFQISAQALMKDYRMAALEVDDQQANGMRLRETVENGKRNVRLEVAPGASAGGTGALIFVDCESAEVARIEWVNGVITTTGEQTVEAGCDGGGSLS